MTFYALSISFFQHVTCCTCSSLDLQLLWLFSWECCYTLSENICVKKVDWYITCQCRSSLRTTLHRLVYCFFFNFLLNILFQWFCLQSQVVSFTEEKGSCTECVTIVAHAQQTTFSLIKQNSLNIECMYNFFFFLGFLGKTVKFLTVALLICNRIYNIIQEHQRQQDINRQQQINQPQLIEINQPQLNEINQPQPNEINRPQRQTNRQPQANCFVDLPG